MPAVALTGLFLSFPPAFAADAPDTNGPAPAEPPTSWIDPDTGHRVIRLTREPGSDSFYFNVNGYTPDGKRMAYFTPNGISVLNLETLEAKRLVAGPARASGGETADDDVHHQSADGENQDPAEAPDGLVEPPAIFAHGPGPADVLPRGRLADG